MNCIGIIPSRYGSTRFPGKPLVKIGNKTMVQRVFEQSKKALDNVIVATDDIRIRDNVEVFGGIAVMTSPDHKTGTDRCNEAVKIYSEKVNTNFDVVINIQGDEPFIDPRLIILLKDCFNNNSVQIATLITKEHETDNIMNPNIVKVITDLNNDAIYFSRSPIPYIRDADAEKWTEKHSYYVHIGIYAYRTNILNLITKMKQSSLETAESLEQNRWIENGMKIKTIITEYSGFSIDTPDDLTKIKIH